ncbi:MAG TPA: FmdB family zinc ribbon protein [Acidimicrobiales bacterium]
MPVYEYACKACGHHLEVSQSFKDEALTECPVCAGPLRKVFGSIGIVLKGSGFYRTDSRLPAKKEKADTAEKADKADSGGGGEKVAGGSSDKPASGDKPAASSSSKSSSGSDAKPASGTVKTA